VDRKDERILLPDNPKGLVRGTSVSNSSVFENQLGILLHTQLHEDYQILIDYPIIFPGRNNRITPDILILKENTIHMILELKVDLGYEDKGWENKRVERLKKLEKYKHVTGYRPFNEKTLVKGRRISVLNLNKEAKADWSVLEKYLRNRLIFR